MPHDCMDAEGRATPGAFAEGSGIRTYMDVFKVCLEKQFVPFLIHQFKVDTVSMPYLSN